MCLRVIHFNIGSESEEVFTPHTRVYLRSTMIKDSKHWTQTHTNTGVLFAMSYAKCVYAGCVKSLEPNAEQLGGFAE